MMVEVSLAVLRATWANPLVLWLKSPSADFLDTLGFKGFFLAKAAFRYVWSWEASI